MNRSLLAAPAAAILLCGLFAGTAMAQEDPPRSCDVVSSELASVEAAAALPVTIQGVTYPNLDAVNTALSGLPAIDAVAPLRTQLQAIVDAAAKVDLLRTEQKTCTTETPPTSQTPAPTTEAPPTTTEPPLYENCDAARAAGAAPITQGEPGYRAELDSDGDGIACEVNEGPAPTTSSDPSTSNGDVATSVPSGSVDTGWAA